MDRQASTLSAAGMFWLFMVGQLVMIAASIAALGGLLMVAGAIGSGWIARFAGSGLLLAAGGGLYLGAWASREYSAQRRP